MAKKLMKPTAHKNMFGVTVMLDGVTTIASNLGFDPVKGRNSKLTQGHLFRYPNAELTDVASALEHLETVELGYNWWFKGETKDNNSSVDGYICIADRMEAGMFAVSHMATWQKWGAEQQAAEAEDRKVKPNKIKVHKDGRITATVTIAGIDDL